MMKMMMIVAVSAGLYCVCIIQLLVCRLHIIVWLKSEQTNVSKKLSILNEVGIDKKY